MENIGAGSPLSASSAPASASASWPGCRRGHRPQPRRRRADPRPRDHPRRLCRRPRRPRDRRRPARHLHQASRRRRPEHRGGLPGRRAGEVAAPPLLARGGGRGRGRLHDQPLLGHRHRPQLPALLRPAWIIRPQARSPACSPTARSAIDQGLKDAETGPRRARGVGGRRGRRDRGRASRGTRDPRSRPARVAQETREADIAATREELERLRVRAAAEIEAEKSRAIADLRAEVADLAMSAAGRIVGESMTGERQRRLVEEFLAEPTPRA